MKFDYWITRPFVRPGEGEDYRPSLVAFKRFPIYYQTVDRGNGMAETVVTQYAYRLYLNLWLIELRFDWEGKRK